MDLLIVDGYNVMHALKRYGDSQKDDAGTVVDKLLADLINLTGLAGIDIVVVFDGRQAGSETKIGRLTVIYSNACQTADMVIERLVFESAGDIKIAVCTGDYAQQKVVGRRGVRRMAPRELEDLMAGVVEESKSKADGVRRSRLEDGLSESVRRRLEEMRRS
ncbi:MAG: NYN domain-containing protein [Actinomycetota bacterium]|nr:NYN domain-containing protein [Actinomycetota bacterium]